MEVKEAVKTAKNYVADLFAEEELFNLGLEEIEFDEASKTWNVTVGFSRPWKSPKNLISNLSGDGQLGRSYRVVKIRDTDGKVSSVTRSDYKSE
jgi:hypothetical protein